MLLIRQWLCVVGLVSALAAQAAPPNIVLITVDTTRADRMGFLGSERGLTPNLDKLAKESVVFTRAYSQAPLTAPSHATILTGTYPQYHRVSDFQLPLANTLPFAPAILKAHGYQTGAFLGSMVLDPSMGLGVGFDRGFDIYDTGFHQAARGEDRFQADERRGSEVVAHALAWLTQHPKGPFFIWVHLYDAHEPYDPPEPYQTQYKSEPYDGEIAYVDSVVANLLSQLRTRGFYDNSLIALMADHGESLGAHGEESHGFFLYDETIHVPLLFKLPGAHPAGERIDRRVALVDVLPTILQGVGILIPKEVQGESLLELTKVAAEGTAPGAASKKFVDPPEYSETDYPHNAFGWSPVRSLRTGKYLFVEAPRRELYDQIADPKADHNLVASAKAVADTLQAQLEAFRQKTSSGGTAPKATADPKAQQKLAALGYMGAGSGTVGGASDVGGIDAKDKIESANMISQANFLLQAWNFEDAIVLLKKVIAKEPDMTMLYTKLGLAQLYLGNFPESVVALRKVVELTPDSPNVYFNLGKAMMRNQDFEGAAAQFKILAEKDPGFWESHVLLEMSYARLGRVPETIQECEKVLAVAPDHFGTNLILGRFLLRKGDADAAVTRLQKAAELRPKAPEPHMALADAYTKLGKDTDAAREREEGKRLQATRQMEEPDSSQ